MIVYDETTPLPTGEALNRWWAELADRFGAPYKAWRASALEATEQWRAFAKAARRCGLVRRSRGARKHARRVKAAERRGRG